MEKWKVKSEVGWSPFPSQDIFSNQYDIPWRRNLFCKHQQNHVMFFLFFVFTPTKFTVTELCVMSVYDWSLLAWHKYRAFRCIVLVVLVFSGNIGTELATIESTFETTRRGGSSRYRRYRCRTLLYLPCIFRLLNETIWFMKLERNTCNSKVNK